MEPTSAILASGTIFEDRYEILEELGSGSLLRVYHARQRSTGQSVAIKLLSAREGAESFTGREVDRFRRETRICAALDHANIVKLIDAGETGDGQLYAVFAYVRGETLAQVLEREGALGVRECVRLMTQVLEALAAAHANGIVHRDLKPANLMLSTPGVRRTALVLNFGLGGCVPHCDPIRFACSATVIEASGALLIERFRERLREHRERILEIRLDFFWRRLDERGATDHLEAPRRLNEFEDCRGLLWECARHGDIER